MNWNIKRFYQNEKYFISVPGLTGWWAQFRCHWTLPTVPPWPSLYNRHFKFYIKQFQSFTVILNTEENHGHGQPSKVHLNSELSNWSYLESRSWISFLWLDNTTNTIQFDFILSIINLPIAQLNKYGIFIWIFQASHDVTRHLAWSVHINQINLSYLHHLPSSKTKYTQSENNLKW